MSEYWTQPSISRLQMLSLLFSTIAVMCLLFRRWLSRVGRNSGPYFCITIGLMLLMTQPAEAQCYRSHCGYSTYSYATPSYTYTYPYTDYSIHATYHLYPPAPAIAGNTVYGYTPPGGLSQFDATEVYKLKLAAGQRYGDLGAQLVQSADTVLTQSLASNDGELQLRKLETLERILKTDRVQQITTVRSSSGASNQYGVTQAEPASADSGQGIVLQSVFSTKCVECHGGARREKNLDLRDLSALSGKMVSLILKRILSDDPNERMPPKDHPQLTWEEKVACVAGAIGGGNDADGPPNASKKNGNGNGDKPPPKPPMPAPVQPGEKR